jgi:hypothetical protein
MRAGQAAIHVDHVMVEVRDVECTEDYEEGFHVVASVLAGEDCYQ